MTKLTQILKQPEGRRLELKADLPTNSELAKTFTSFTNDAGSEFYLGIQYKPENVVGIDENNIIIITFQVIKLSRTNPAITLKYE
ncbi:MAG: hypothetical protein GY834_15275 [Bacteroidetes bacterium]|nr:hypothetical protein [Bacteroidota bacterium]